MLAGILTVVFAGISMMLIAATTSARFPQASWLLMHTGAFGAVLLTSGAFLKLEERSPGEAAGLAGSIAAVWSALILQLYGFGFSAVAPVLMTWVAGAAGGAASASLLNRDRFGASALAAGLALVSPWALAALR